MKVSIVVTTYNSSNTLGRALQSLGDQTYRPSEVLVIDDASEDFQRTADGCQAFETATGIPTLSTSSPVKVNAAHSRNIGLTRAAGDMICFLDGDDFFYPRKIEELVLAATNAGGDFVYVNHFAEVVAEKIFRVHEQDARVIAQDIDEYMFVRSRLIQTSCIALPRSLRGTLFFDERLNRFQDYAFLLSIKGRGVDLVGYGTRPLSAWNRSDNYSAKASRLGEGRELVDRFMTFHGHLMSPGAKMGFQVRHLAGPLRSSKSRWFSALFRLAVSEPRAFMSLICSKFLSKRK